MWWLRPFDIGWRTAIVIVAVIAANVVGYIRWDAKRDPRYALEQAAESLRRHDASLFDTWVDVDKLAGSYYDQHLLPARLRDRSFNEIGRNRDIAAIARRLRRWVVTGRIDEDETPRLTLLGKTLQRAIALETEKVTAISRGRRTVLASVTVHDDAGHRTTLEIRLDRQRGGAWRISEVTNVEAVVDDLRKSEQQRIRGIEKRLNDAIGISKPKLIGEHVVPDQVTRDYAFVVMPAVPSRRVEWGAVCESDMGLSEVSGQVLEFPNKSPKTIRVKCRCRTACREPVVRVESVLLQDGTTIRRDVPLPLD